MSEDKYISVSIDFSKFTKAKVDVRVPVYLTLKEILRILIESLQIDMEIVNPTVRVLQSGKIIHSLTTLEESGEDKNGIILFVEEK